MEVRMEYNFFAMMSRMKLISRWALMRNSRSENISEHSLEVSMIAHALAIISNERLGNQLNVEKIALLAIYHDTTEIITGDMPTPIKYFNQDIQGAYKEIESYAAKRLLHMLPKDMQKSYESIFFPIEGEEYLWKLVKAADKLSALIKCLEEENTGNAEFSSAKVTISESLDQMQLREVTIFREEFLPAFSKTLDEISE